MEARTNKTKFPTKPITVDVANAISKDGQSPPLYFHSIYYKKTIYLFIKLFNSWYTCIDNLQRGSHPPTITKVSNTVRAPATIETGTHKAAKITVEISLK